MGEDRTALASTPPAGVGGVPWSVLGRYALLVALVGLLPVPLLDTWLENRLRRRLVRSLARRAGRELAEDDLAVLGDLPPGGCSGCLVALVLRPIKKLLGTLMVVWQAKSLADSFSDVVHRGVLLQEAFALGALPGEAKRVRAAMDAALKRVDPRFLERHLGQLARDRRDELSRAMREAAAAARQPGRRVEGMADAADQDAVGPELRALSTVMVDVVRLGLSTELLWWFRHELGHQVPGSPPPAAGSEVSPGSA